MAEMTQAQFEVVAELLRSREPVRTAARLVLVEGVTTKAQFCIDTGAEGVHLRRFEA